MLSWSHRFRLLSLCISLSLFISTWASSPPPIPTSQVQCKCLPGDPCYPSAREWQKFSARLSRPLIVNQKPLGSVCYPSSGSGFSPSLCATATRNINDPTFRQGLTNTLQYETFEVLFNATGGVMEQCPYGSGVVTSQSAECKLGRIPPNAVNVTTVQDIQEAAKFASKFNLKLVVRNTGHELLGRSGGVDALEVSTRNLQNISFHDNFVPENVPRNTRGEFAVTAYRELHAHNRSLPGGLAPSGTLGSAGGWLLGGGHSPLSRYFGYGVDNALQFKVVLPDASFVTANKYKNPDLFWALRGGGGPSFGIVVESIVKTHPDLPYTAFFFIAQAASKNAYTNLLEVWNRYNNGLNDAGWGGIWPFTYNSLALTLLNQGTPPFNPNGKPLMDKFLAEANEVSGVTITTQEYINFTSFQDWNIDIFDNGRHGFDFTQRTLGAPNSVTSSCLLPRNVTAPENARSMAKIYANLTGGTGFMIGGGLTATNNPADVSSKPAFRNIGTDIVILPTGPGPPPTTIDNIEVLRRNANRQNQVFKQLAPPPYGGQYVNEPDYYEEDWQQAYWGDNYARLLRIKKQIDPKDLLVVHKGVNSEAWDTEVTCKNIY